MHQSNPVPKLHKFKSSRCFFISGENWRSPWPLVSTKGCGRRRSPTRDETALHPWTSMALALALAWRSPLSWRNGSMERGKARSWVTSDDYPCLFFPVQCSEVYSVVTFGTSLSTTRIKWNHHQLRPAAINTKLRFSSTRKQADQQSFKLPESYYVSMIQQQYTTTHAVS